LATEVGSGVVANVQAGLRRASARPRAGALPSADSQERASRFQLEKGSSMLAAVSSLESPPDVAPGIVDDPSHLRAAHTPNFPALLRPLRASLLVTTYQAGKLVIVRDERGHTNTHYRSFQTPMGLALADGGARLAIGTTIQVWEFRDVPAVAYHLE